MATREFIENRIEGKEKEIAKLEKKLARIRKVEAQNWEDPNPYFYSEHDLKWCLKDLESAKKGLEKYQEELKVIIEKESSRNVQVIIDFLEKWKSNSKAWYMIRVNEYFEEKAEVHELYEKFETLSYGTPERKEAEERYTEASKKFRENCKGKYETINKNGYTRNIKVVDGKYECIAEFIAKNIADTEITIDKALKNEAERKYDDIIARTNDIVGQITDASGLYIDVRANLNGVIVGTRGSAKVETIGAGGYNIQCFHFRTLIHSI